MSRPPVEPDRRALGPGFAKLWTAAATSSLGDGVYLAGLPLLAAQLTRDPLPVAMVAMAGWLPWLLLGLVSGALADRLDRRRLLWSVDAARCAALGAFALAVVTGAAGIPLLLAVAFLLGAGQTLFDSAAQALLPTLVSREPARLERANSRLFAAQTITSQFAGPPLGGLLFTAGAALPFLVDAGSFAVSSTLIATLPSQPSRPPADAPPGHLGREILLGLRWLAGQPLLRALAVVAAGSNLAMMAGEAVLVLLAQQRLGLGTAGYGLLLTGLGAGSVLGSVLAPRVRQRLGARLVLITGLLVAAVAWLILGSTSSPWIAGVMLAVNGAATMTWNVVTVSLRQALVPDHLLGRVVSAFRMLGLGAIPAGAILGGLLARQLGLRAPFLAGAALMAALVVLSLPVLATHRRSASERGRAGS